jgi:adenylate cyclase
MTGIGLASGTLHSGNAGSADRVEYAAIGDATNTAARLQAMTRDKDATVLIAASVVERLVERPADLAELGEREVRGKDQPLRVYTLGAGNTASLDAATSTLAE